MTLGRSAAALLLLSSCAAPPTVREVRVDPASPAFERLDLDLVHRVDSILQERFATVTDEDIKLSRFGYSRISPKRAHPRSFVPESELERELMTRVSSSGWRAAVFTIGNWHGMPPVAHGPLALGGAAWGPREGLSMATQIGIECMKTGLLVQSQDGPVALEARPVLASKPVCLRCHDNRKAGDVLGAVITAFQKERPPVATSGQ